MASFVGLDEAARLTGKNKTTIWRRIGKGLSAVKEEGVYKVDVAELERVFGKLKGGATSATEVCNDMQSEAETEILKVKLEYAERALMEVRQDRDAWRSVAENALRALPAPAATPDAMVRNVVVEAPRRKFLWLIPLPRRVTT